MKGNLTSTFLFNKNVSTINLMLLAMYVIVKKLRKGTRGIKSYSKRQRDAQILKFI